MLICSSCKYFKENDKKEGALCGVKYYCSKMKCYIDGYCNSCNNYKKSYSRSNYECDELYNDEQKFSYDNKLISFYIIALILNI